MKLVTRAVLVTPTNGILLGRRVRNDEVGKLAFIGGKPEEEETPRDAIVREVFEETGASISPTFWFHEEDTTSDPGSLWQVHYFLARVNKGDLKKIKPDELSEIVEVTSHDFESYDITFGHKDKIRKVYQENIIATLL